MGFGAQIKTTKQEVKPAPSWMSQPIEEKPKEHPKEQVITPIQSEQIFWSYPELKTEKVVHKIPKVLETAVLKNADFANWFETVWMLLNLNARWNMNEAIIPEHLRHYVGARSIGIDGNWKSEKNEVIWYLYK
jgi:hypothetical protein